MIGAGEDHLADCITCLKSLSFPIFISTILYNLVMNDILLSKQENYSTFTIVLFYSTFVAAFKWEKSGNGVHN